MKCRHCASELSLSMLDLGSAPPSNAYLTEAALKRPEKWFPLRVLVCQNCWLVQTEDFADAKELFDSEYAYFSAFSSSWLAHCERYVADIVASAGLDSTSHVVEVAANDGYLLQYFKQRGIPCTGVEPTASTASAARAKGIPIVEEFFGVKLAQDIAARDGKADLIAANNVLAHVPDINDFVAGFAVLLKADGQATFEFPHLLRLVAGNQFDTVYHEHYSYLSLSAVERIFSANGLSLFDVQEHPTHGGSLRVFAQRADTGKRQRSESVDRCLRNEQTSGMLTADYYAKFQLAAEGVKNAFLAFLLQARKEGRTVAGYGAAAKGNTLMNFAGLRPDLLEFVVDRNPAKQGRYMPGSRIPIFPEAVLLERKPDYVVILPWNLRQEVVAQLAYVGDWGGRFVTAVPELEVSPA
jgi:predicted TPR repeat methyltransferase